MSISHHVHAHWATGNACPKHLAHALAIQDFQTIHPLAYSIVEKVVPVTRILVKVQPAVPFVGLLEFAFGTGLLLQTLTKPILVIPVSAPLAAMTLTMIGRVRCRALFVV